MDVALGLNREWRVEFQVCLNPCCNGCRTWTWHGKSLRDYVSSLNPCCNGCRTWTPVRGVIDGKCNNSVLILVVMDVALGLKSAILELR